MIQRVNETKSWFFEKINKIDKPLVKVTKRRKETQINKIRDEKGILQQILIKLKKSCGKILKTYTPENWKIKKDKFLNTYDTKIQPRRHKQHKQIFNE
jgi:hypothetical protein